MEGALLTIPARFWLGPFRGGQGYGVNGAGKSKLTPLLVDKACGSPATGRNWNSVLKIGEMIEARG
jgi:hypothetical protein